jgi:hypothetical protein
MWFGLLYGMCEDAPAPGARLDAHPAAAEGAMVILYAWEAGRDRPFTVAGPLSATPDMVRLLRDAAIGTQLLTPHCDACGAALDLPLD